MTSPQGPDRLGDFAASTWAELARPIPAVGTFDPSSLDDLPPPAARFLTAAVSPGSAIARGVELSMRGQIKLMGRWWPFRARQILQAGVGFVWAPIVGNRVVRFIGADALGPDGAEIEFRLHGRLPVVRGSGPDVERSAAGRLAAETVAWLPQALVPQAGAVWTAIDDRRAVVAVPGKPNDVEVEVTVDEDGRLEEVGLLRWRDGAEPPAEEPFGGAVTDVVTIDGVSIAARGEVGWGWRTAEADAGLFFRYQVESAHFPASPGL